jgi:hypothetical protein
VNKKKQKNFITLGHGLVADKANVPAQQKFLRRFFQKAAAFLRQVAGIPPAH